MSNANSNVSTETNVTFPSSNITWPDDSNVILADDIASIFSVYFGVDVCILIVGTLLNLWSLVAILRSRDLRSRLRNKIICNMFVLHLVDSAVVIPFLTTLYILSWHSISTTCHVYSIAHIIQVIQETITNWQLVMLIVVFIAQIQDFNLKVKLSRRIVQIGTWAILIIPWAVSIILVPSVSFESLYLYNCFMIPYSTKQIMKILDTALPIILAVLLMLLAVFLRYRRFNRGHSRSMGTELISRGPEIDSALPYIVAVVISTACEIIHLIDIIDYTVFSEQHFFTILRIHIAGELMSNARVILMLLPWLLLPDIRERIKTWRPWRGPGPSIDLTVTYKKETT